MKIRTDFVTNSSSSSFVVFGVDKDNISITKEGYVNIFEYNLKQYKDYMGISDEEIKNMTDDDKAKYAENKFEQEDIYSDDIFSIGGPEYDVVGITPFALIRKFPNEKIEDIYKIAAREFNKKFGTNFTEDDIRYNELSW